MSACYTCGKEANQRSEGGMPYCNKCKLTHAAPKEEKTDFWPKEAVKVTANSPVKGDLYPMQCIHDSGCDVFAYSTRTDYLCPKHGDRK